LEDSNNSLKATVAELQKEFRRTLAQQQEEIKDLTASLKEQESLLQKVSALVQVNRPAPRVAANNDN
jgi:peptidoglycan hydrolase CwlO-like protein